MLCDVVCVLCVFFCVVVVVDVVCLFVSFWYDKDVIVCRCCVLVQCCSVDVRTHVRACESACV